ncbi:MAG: RNA polymerase factor sigma-54 [Bacteroides sp.]|nr:MAG: RNA polymerase factor sigma-54 [Bacteroides sp.]
MLKQKIDIKLFQKICPQQIQFIKLLQLPGHMLKKRINEELEINPVLDCDNIYDTENNEEYNFKNYNEEYQQDIDNSNLYYQYNSLNYKKGENNVDISNNKSHSIYTDFYDYLYQQLEIMNLNYKDNIIMRNLIGNIDINGYLHRSLLAIIHDISLKENITCSQDDINRCLSMLHKFDPPGIGARNLKECLLIQLINNYSDNPKKSIELAILIIDKYFYELYNKHYSKLENKLSCDSNFLKLVIDEIVKLNPKPGNSILDKNIIKKSDIIIPDFRIINLDNKLRITLNDNNYPSLKINNFYIQIMQKKNSIKMNKKNDNDTINFIKNKIDSAKWFINAINQRKLTLINTMQAIIQYQYKYFLTGNDIYLKPMILNDIALKTNMDVSTISRIANNKYVETDFGIFKLKYFFSEGINTFKGEKVSTKKIKKILKLNIINENKQKPLSDNLLANKMKKEGYKIARRTISKYREQLKIPIARLRKKY